METEETGGLAHRIMIRADRGGIHMLVGSYQAHRRTYREGQRMNGKVFVNCYPFWYVKYT